MWLCTAIIGTPEVSSLLPSTLSLPSGTMVLFHVASGTYFFGTPLFLPVSTSNSDGDRRFRPRPTSSDGKTPLNHASPRMQRRRAQADEESGATYQLCHTVTHLGPKYRGGHLQRLGRRYGEEQDGLREDPGLRSTKKIAEAADRNGTPSHQRGSNNIFTDAV